MEKNKREFIIDDLMISGFIEIHANEICLEEYEDTGRSKLKLSLSSNDNLCIANVDKKKTELHFFQKEKLKSLFKRVDHIIFEHQNGDKWKLHLIEMKGSVGEEKWTEIKGKFRASYLLSQAIAGMLELNISETIMYTTFEKVKFKPSDTMPTARRTRSGQPTIKMEQEWDGKNFGLNFGERISFVHLPIQMKRNNEGILVGSLTI